MTARLPASLLPVLLAGCDLIFPFQAADGAKREQPPMQSDLSRPANDLPRKIPGLVGWWRMDEPSWNGTANEVQDSSGSGNAGRASCYGACSPPTTTPGKLGRGGQFDGNDDYVSLGNSSSLNLTQALTVSMWVKLSSSGHQYFLDKYWGCYGLAVTEDRRFVVKYRDQSSGSEHWVYGTTNPTTNAWYHVAGTIDSKGQASIYVNGALEASEPFSGASVASNTDALILGCQGDLASGNYCLDGILDDVRVYNYAQPRLEIARDMNAAR